MYDRRPLYLTWGGQIGNSGGGVDVWQNGLHIAGEASYSDGQKPTASEMEEAYDIIATFHSAATTKIAAGAVLTFVKAAILNVDGSYFSEPVAFQGDPVQGGMTTGTDGPQSAGVVTLWSGQTLGRANYGRWYVPWWKATVSHATGTVGSSEQEELLDNAELMINALNAWAADNVAADALIRIMSTVGTGTTKTPSALRVGNVKDTQRRRRNRIPETYMQNDL